MRLELIRLNPASGSRPKTMFSATDIAGTWGNSWSMIEMPTLSASRDLRKVTPAGHAEHQPDARQPLMLTAENVHFRSIPAGRALVCVALPSPRPVVHAVRGIICDQVGYAGEPLEWV
jgi:hypothetical protein